MNGLMIWHDKRLAQNPNADSANYLETVDQNTQFETSLERIARIARMRRPVNRLNIICNGVSPTRKTIGQKKRRFTDGGFGLQLCRDNLSFANVSRMAILYGLVREIVIYTRNIPDSNDDSAESARAAKRLFGEIAHYTDANVYAVDESQMSSPGFYNDTARY